MRSQITFILGMMLILAAACLAGCAGPPTPEIKVSGNSICAIGSRSWSIEDTKESIEEAIRFNNGLASAKAKAGCSEKKAVS